MKKSTIIAVFVLLVLAILLIGFAVQTKIKNKQAAEKALAEALAVKPVVNNYYAETVQNMDAKLNDSMVTDLVNAAAKNYLSNLKKDYDCQKLEALETGEMYLTCARVK